MDSAHSIPSSINDPAALYGYCLDAHNVQEVLGYGLQYLSTIVEASQLTYIDIDTPTVRCVGTPPNDALTVRMLAHARRCLEGVDKHQFDAQKLTIEAHEQLSAYEPSQGDEPGLIWTASMTHDGRLTGVLNIYGYSSTPNTTELAAIREARKIMAEGIHRLKSLGEKTPNAVNPEESVDMFIVTLRAGFEGGDVTGLVMSQLQRAVADRLASKIPAFMVAKLGLNRLMVVGHPSNPLPLRSWEQLCIKAIFSLEQEMGVDVAVELSQGDMDSLGETPIFGLVSKPIQTTTTRIQSAI
jgi:hypothetical protein